MGRHSRKEPAPAPARPAPVESGPHEAYEVYEAYEGRQPSPPYQPYGTNGGHPSHDGHPSRGGYQGYETHQGNGGYAGSGGYDRGVEPTVTHGGYVPQARLQPDTRAGGHPELREHGGAWGAAPADSSGAGTGNGAVYGDWRGVPRSRTAPASASAYAPGSVLDTNTPAFGTPAVGFPQVTLPAPRLPEPEPMSAPESGLDAVTSTGSHRRIPGPRTPAAPVEEPQPGAPRSRKARAFTGIAAAAVTTVLAVVVAGQVNSEGDTRKTAAQSADDDSPSRALPGRSAPSLPQTSSGGTATGGRSAVPDAASPSPAAPELTYDQKMAQQLPIDEKLKGPGTFDTVPGVAKAPGKGKLIRYRVDVEQGLGLDPQLFAEAVQRTLNDPRSWAHNGAMTFERVPDGDANFVITLASPGTTGVWCAKSDLDTTVDNVSCDSASTSRVMINAFRWAQGSPTYGANQMFAYRQMLINHEVGHRLGHGHENCRTPGDLAPIMQQQTKSLNLDGIQCKPNPWVFPGS